MFLTPLWWEIVRTVGVAAGFTIMIVITGIIMIRARW